MVPEAKLWPNRMADYKLCEKVNRAESPVYFILRVGGAVSLSAS